MMHFGRSIPVLLVLVAIIGCGGGGASGGGSSGIPVGVPPTASPSSGPTVGPTPTAMPSATPTPPAAQASLYALEASDINAFSSGVAAQCPTNPSATTRVDIELLQANSNALVTSLSGASVAQAQAMAGNAVAFAVQVRKLLPGVGFMLNPLYPVLVQNQANAPTWWSTSTKYPIFSAYYAALAQGLGQNGIPYDVETNIVFPAYSGQGYSSVSIAQLEAGEGEQASNVLTLMSPQHLNLASEPLTLSENTGQASLNTVSGFQSFVSAIRNAVVVPGGSTTLLGAGSADWSSTSFLTALESVSGLQYYDMHLYPPDVLTSPGGGIAQVNAISPNVTGKPGVITETWDEKDAGNAGSYGAANAQLLEQQNVYSFWYPLDAQYITSMVRLARCQNISVVSFWYEYELFAYLDYASASTMTPQAAQSAISSAGTQAAFAGTLSPSGAALYTAITGKPAP